MPGTILIVDGVAINRIVLKVKLTAAFYAVNQATTAAEARQSLAATACDLVIVGESFDAAALADLLATLSDAVPGGRLPCVVVSSDGSEAFRLAALRAGACDVLVRPVRDAVLLARLRNLLRRDQPEVDGAIDPAGLGWMPEPAAVSPLAVDRPGAHAYPRPAAPVSGLAEAAPVFAPPARVALVAMAGQRDRGTLRRLHGGLGAPATLLTPAQVLAGGDDDWDVIVLEMPEAASPAHLALISDLRARAGTRACGIVLILPAGCDELVPTAFDLGADDVVFEESSGAELRLRLAALLRHKRQADGRRDRLRDRLRASVTDPLTGLCNRRYAVPFLRDRLAALSTGASHGCAVMLIDIDHFKQVNDRHGHAAGDRALTEVARRLSRTVPDGALVSRTGGEEFLVILPGAGRGAALELAERLRHAVARAPVALEPGSDREGGSLDLTVSVGVTVAGPRDAELSPEKVIDRADRAMYAAKSRGRDRVESHHSTSCASGEVRPRADWPKQGAALPAAEAGSPRSQSMRLTGRSGI